MKNILLSVVVVATLVAAGVGGTLADFSDYEVSEGNYFKTGALDLTVSNFMGVEEQGDDVDVLCAFKDAIPCCDKSFFFDLENHGQGDQGTPHAYMHIKNLECGWVVPKVVWEWIECDPVTGECVIATPPDPLPVHGDQGTGYPKPVNEPEFVAECGGVAGEDVNGDPVVVPGVGCCFGEDCQLARHVGITIEIAGPYPHETKPARSDLVDDDDWTDIDLSDYDDDPADDDIKVNELVCEQIDLGNVPYNEGIWVHVALHLQDIDEDDLIDQGLLTDPGTGYGWFDDTIDAEAKFDHWPTNALQKDSMHFDIGFELLQY
jgi:predicted ribosomally synthesized peptide with SipW-like signal peptide